MRRSLLLIAMFAFMASSFAQQFNLQSPTGVKVNSSINFTNDRAVDTVWTYVLRSSGFYIYSAGQGYVIGNNYADLTAYGLAANEPWIMAVGMHYDGVANASITEVLTSFGAKHKEGTADVISCKVWAIDADTVPTSELFTTDITTDDIDTSAGAFTSVMVNPAVDLSGSPYMIGFEFYAMTDDTVGILSNFAGDTAPTPGDGLQEKRLRCNFGTNLQTNYGFGWSPMNGGAFTDYDADGMIIPVLDITTGADFPVSNGLTLKGAYPNPTNSTAIISYSIDKAQTVKVRVFDITGKVVLNTEEFQTQGNHKVNVDFSELSNGNYYYTIIANGTALTSKISVVK